MPRRSLEVGEAVGLVARLRGGLEGPGGLLAQRLVISSSFEADSTGRCYFNPWYGYGYRYGYGGFYGYYGYPWFGLGFGYQYGYPYPPYGYVAH